MSRLSEHGIRLSSMSPSFLNSNSTSHTRPFSAVAELIDNATDPGVSAKQIWIDVVEDAGHLCLTVTDNGSGMTPSKLHRMLSFGFTDKGSGRVSQTAIGLYGNGFKSGSMRLGRDALIFTKNGGCQTVGLLSQTYLETIKAQAIIVPIAPFNQQTKSLVVTEDSEASLAAILTHSIVSSQEQIHAHFASIVSKKGTKILMWNIRRSKDGKPEIDFETDGTDFRLPEIQIEEMRKGLMNSGIQDVPDIHFSLRAYLSILYLKPRTQIILRGKKIVTKLVSKRLTHTEHDVYKPHFSKEKVKVTFGLDLKNKDHYGILMYHKNRLIKAYEKVGCQLKGSGQRAGVGVIGIIECNFLKPAHNKQDFEYTKEYRLTLGALGLKLNDYWKEVTKKMSREREFRALDAREDEAMWLQCEECLKWRSVPLRFYSDVPERWDCSQNPNPRYRSCSSPEEEDKSEETLSPSYQKNHKKPDHLKSRKRERSAEVDELEDHVVKHQVLSEPPPDRGPKEENAHEGDETDTHMRDATQLPHKQEKLLVRIRVVKKDKERMSKRRVDEDGDRQRVEGEDRKKEEEDADTSRKSGSELTGEEEAGLGEELPPDSQNMVEEVGPDNPAGVSDTEKTNQGICCWLEKPGDAEQDTPLNLTWSQPRPSTAREATELKLAALETEVQELRRLLGLDDTKTTGGHAPEKLPAASASREVGCQTDTESSASSSSLVLVQGPREQQNRRSTEKTDAQSTTGEPEACEDSSSPQESLRCVRHNMVALLTALLPQLDLTGISLETTDVDDILQRIIEVNAL